MSSEKWRLLSRGHVAVKDTGWCQDMLQSYLTYTLFKCSCFAKVHKDGGGAFFNVVKILPHLRRPSGGPVTSFRVSRWQPRYSPLLTRPWWAKAYKLFQTTNPTTLYHGKYADYSERSYQFRPFECLLKFLRTFLCCCPNAEVCASKGMEWRIILFYNVKS